MATILHDPAVAEAYRAYVAAPGDDTWAAYQAAGRAAFNQGFRVYQLEEIGMSAEAATEQAGPGPVPGPEALARAMYERPTAGWRRSPFDAEEHGIRRIRIEDAEFALEYLRPWLSSGLIFPGPELTWSDVAQKWAYLTARETSDYTEDVDDLLAFLEANLPMDGGGAE